MDTLHEMIYTNWLTVKNMQYTSKETAETPIIT